MLLLDSHVVAWYFAGSSSIGRGARGHITREERRAGLRVSALTFFELEHTLRAGRLRGLPNVEHLREEVLSLGVKELPLDGESCVRAVDFRHSLPDAFDALIAATADIHDLTLLTADAEILAWKGRVKRIDARK